MSKDVVVATGQVPFVVLEGRGTVLARYVTVRRDVPEYSLADSEYTSWTLALDGKEFLVVAEDGRHVLSIDEVWATGREEPMIAKGGIVSYDFYYSHHLGSVSGTVKLTFDVDAMTVTVEDDLEFEAD